MKHIFLIVLFLISKSICAQCLDDSYYWYINGDKSNKMKNVVYANHYLQFPDSIVSAKVTLFDGDGVTGDEVILKLPDILHHCYNVNEMILDLGYPANTEIVFTFFNKNKTIIVLEEYSETVVVKLL